MPTGPQSRLFDHRVEVAQRGSRRRGDFVRNAGSSHLDDDVVPIGRDTAMNLRNQAVASGVSSIVEELRGR